MILISACLICLKCLIDVSGDGGRVSNWQDGDIESDIDMMIEMAAMIIAIASKQLLPQFQIT